MIKSRNSRKTTETDFVLKGWVERGTEGKDLRGKIQTLLCSFQPPLSFADREWIERTIARNDKDGDGGISLEEFIEMNTKSRLARAGSRASDAGIRATTTLDKAKLAFNAYDRNRDGYLTKAELRKTSKTMTDAQIDAVFEKYDKNKVSPKHTNLVEKAFAIQSLFKHNFFAGRAFDSCVSMCFYLFPGWQT